GDGQPQVAATPSRSPCGSRSTRRASITVCRAPATVGRLRPEGMWPPASGGPPGRPPFTGGRRSIPRGAEAARAVKVPQRRAVQDLRPGSMHRGRSYRRTMDQSEILDCIKALVAEEHRLRPSGPETAWTLERLARLEEIETSLDQMWDLLRQARCPAQSSSRSTSRAASPV